MTNEEKAIQKVLDAISDIRLDTDYLAFYLQQTLGPARSRLDEVLAAAGYRYQPDEELIAEEDDTSDEEENLNENSTTVPAWVGIIHKILNGSEEVSRGEISALGMDLALEYFNESEAYGEVGALAGRVIWTFEDDHVLWFDAETEDLIISHLEKEMTADDIDSILDDEALPAEDFVWSSGANGWRYDGDFSAWDLADVLENHFGTVKMFFPWEMVLDNMMVEDGFEEFAEATSKEIETPEEEAAVRAAHSFMEFVLQGASDGETKIAGVEDYFAGITTGDDFMPRYSAVGRFNRFLTDLEEKHNWAIVYDECCGTCSRSSIEWAQSEEGKENSPVFVTWGQNAKGSWSTGGSVNHMHLAAPEEIAVIQEVAAANNLEVEVEESSPSVSGEEKFIYISGE